MMFAVGARIPASQVQEQELIAYKKMELQTISDTLDQHLLLCAQEKVEFKHAIASSKNAKKTSLCNQLQTCRH